jgi:hypothetical protein
MAQATNSEAIPPYDKLQVMKVMAGDASLDSGPAVCA